MLRRYQHADGEPIVFRVPPTTADVLEWRVWIACIDDTTEQIWCALQWAARWVEDMTAAEIGDTFDTPEQIVNLCNAIADAAGLPADVRAQMSELLDAENEVPHDWRPQSVCACTMCRRGVAVEGSAPCLYEKYPPHIVPVLAHVFESDATDAPYYVAQVNGIRNAAESRRLRYRREMDEAKAKAKDMLDEMAQRAGFGGPRP